MAFDPSKQTKVAKVRKYSFEYLNLVARKNGYDVESHACPVGHTLTSVYKYGNKADRTFFNDKKVPEIITEMGWLV